MSTRHELKCEACGYVSVFVEETNMAICARCFGWIGPHAPIVDDADPTEATCTDCGIIFEAEPGQEQCNGCWSERQRDARDDAGDAMHERARDRRADQ